ncbi:MAG: hypothetical protein ABEN55_10435 [Bradymonadaceae bacterium]
MKRRCIDDTIGVGWSGSSPCSAQGFRVESSTRKAADYSDHIVIIELPPPEATTEAYMVGLVVRSSNGRPAARG